MIKFSVKGEKWKFYVFSHEEFVSKFGEGMEAFADCKHKQVFFNADDLTMETVRHEIWHVYVHYLRLDAVDLSAGQLEEIYAEMFAKDGVAMLDLSTKVLNKLRQLE